MKKTYFLFVLAFIAVAFSNLRIAIGIENWYLKSIIFSVLMISIICMLFFLIKERKEYQIGKTTIFDNLIIRDVFFIFVILFLIDSLVNILSIIWLVVGINIITIIVGIILEALIVRLKQEH